MKRTWADTRCTSIILPTDRSFCTQEIQVSAVHAGRFRRGWSIPGHFHAGAPSPGCKCGDAVSAEYSCSIRSVVAGRPRIPANAAGGHSIRPSNRNAHVSGDRPVRPKTWPTGSRGRATVRGPVTSRSRRPGFFLAGLFDDSRLRLLTSVLPTGPPMPRRYLRTQPDRRNSRYARGTGAWSQTVSDLIRKKRHVRVKMIADT